MNIIPGNSIVREFEYKIANYCDAKHCLSVCNATMGILGIFYALGLGNTEIIASPLTWAGAFSGLKMLNCKIKFCDVEPENLTINPDLIEPLISSKTKAVFSADFLGYPARLDRIREICDKHNLLLIHDAASSFGSRYKGLYSGYFADVTVLSFGAKKIFSIGEGGCVLTNRAEIYSKLVQFMMHPERQNVETFQNNPFALNTNINPLAAKFALENFDQNVKNIKLKQGEAANWLKHNTVNETRPSDEPNYYKIVIALTNLVDDVNGFLINVLPFRNLVYNDRNFDTCDKIVYNCPLAENALNQYKIISLQL
jgi:dTDP-4-amino-4,6-dideoxygalactose transaminase